MSGRSSILRRGMGGVSGLPKSGLTLIELLFVMMILGLLFGVGLGTFASLDFGDKAARSSIESTLRAANNWAIAREAPALVRFDPRERTYVAEGLDVIGTWHFESMPVEGAFELGGVEVGNSGLNEDGFQGRALSFNGAPSNSRISIPVHKDGAYDVGLGFAIECVVRREVESGGQILDLGEVINLQVDEDGVIRTFFASEAEDELGERRAGGRAVLVTDPGMVPVDRWTRIGIEYDRVFFRILVDGRRVATLEQDARVMQLESGLILGGSSSPFPGSIDNLTISAVGVEEVFELPEGLDFAPNCPRQVLFAAGGGLERRVHREPVRVPLIYLDGREDFIQINLYGTVE